MSYLPDTSQRMYIVVFGVGAFVIRLSQISFFFSQCLRKYQLAPSIVVEHTVVLAQHVAKADPLRKFFNPN